MNIKINIKKKSLSFINGFFSIFFIPLSKIFSKNNTVLLGTYSRNKYGENTKYLFEYLSSKNDIRAYWITDNKDIIKKLKEKKLKYIGLKNPFTMLWVLLRTKIIVDSGTGYFNPFGILSPRNVIKVTTSHGNGPKVTVSRFHPPDNHNIGLQQIQDLYKFDYINYPSSFSAKMIGKRVHLLPNHKIISLGYPRCDQYSNKDYVSQAYNNKKIAKSICSEINLQSRVILYTPTWRPYDYNFPLNYMDGMKLENFDKWLMKKNTFFFFSVHTAHQPQNIPQNLKRIVFIDPDRYPFYDVNKFMMEVDILLNDYSTTSTDIALLKTQQIFFMPDYQQYEEESGFIEDYKKILPGKEIFSFESLKETIEYIFLNKYDYLDLYEANRLKLIKKYYDFIDNGSCHEFYKFIQNLLKS